MRKPPRTLAELLLRSNSAASGLFDQIRHLALADHRLREVLGAPFNDRVRLANIREDTAVIHVDSASTLTLLRFRYQELLQILSSCDGISCQRLEFSVDPALFKV
jgi:hypothetical protein